MHPSGNLFSEQSEIYAASRPIYPDALYAFLMRHVTCCNRAWDCATGNGQAARALIRFFDEVYATDISARQLHQAPPAPNLFYRQLPAEQTDFPDHYFDLITVAQALHWLSLPEFYAEVFRTAKDNCLFASWGYSLPSVNTEVDIRLENFYRHTVGPFWDDARKHVENRYLDLPFPFNEIPAPSFEIKVRWTAQTFGGYLASWSATRQYIRHRKHHPVPDFMEKIKPLWPGELTVSFPVFMRVGRIKK